MLRIAMLTLILQGVVAASTIEVVQLYQPLSLHRTDGVGEVEDGEDLLQAAVLGRPFAVSGALPEDLVKAVTQPHRIPSNNPAYVVVDANLLNLCQVGLTTTMKEDRLLVRLDVSKLSIPEEIDLTSRQILKLAILAVRRTVTEFYKESHEHLEISIGVTGTDQGNDSLNDLATRFKVGG